MATGTLPIASTAHPPVVPPAEGALLRARRAYEYWLVNYRRTWRGTAVSSVAEPLFFLAAMGVGLGSLVNRHGLVDGVPYLHYVGPGLVAATAMQIAGFESTWPVLGGVKWNRLYLAMTATPLTASDVLAGHAAWVATRIASSAAVYLAFVAAFGALGSWWSLAIVPAALLLGMAFALPIMGYAVTKTNETAFSILYRFVIIPLFLFSGTFFPISQLPQWLHPVAYVTPLWHGVTLVRDLALGRVHPGAVAVHVAYLAVWCVAGALYARRTYRRRLVV